MKKSIIILTLITSVFLLFSACTQQAIDVKSDITEVNIAFMEAVNNGDADALSNIYLQDAIVYPPNSESISGADNIVPMMAGLKEQGIEMTFETVSAMAYGMTAIEEGKYKVMIGESMVDHGKYIVIWKKEENAWKVSRDIWNSSMPPVAEDPHEDTGDEEQEAE